MGRKIPAKKHRGVKDPLVQQAKRAESLKGKINAPPRDPDEQPVPKSLLRLFGAAGGERRAHRPSPRAPARHERKKEGARNPVARLQRLPGESARCFSRRITGATRALHTADDPHHYPLEEEEGEGEGDERRARRRRGEGGAPRESKAQRRKLKLQQKRQEAAKERAAEAASAVVYERVAFGEQAHAPPALPAPRLPRAPHQHTSVPRPGRRQLLLSSLLAGGGGAGAGGGVGSGGGGGVLAERRRLDAVAAYRALKKQQRESTSHRNTHAR